MHHVAKRSRMSVQLVSYHLEQMLEWGIIVASTDEDKTVYTLQEAYYEDELLEDLSTMFIPYMNNMREGMDFSQIKVSSTEAVIRNLFMFLRLFQTEIEKRPLGKKGVGETVFEVPLIRHCADKIGSEQNGKNYIPEMHEDTVEGQKD